MSIRVAATGLLLFLILQRAGSMGADDFVDFNRDVRPILSENCFHCHGPDAAAREANLRLDVADDSTLGVVAPGRPDQSELIRRITSRDSSERMPPADSERSLTEDQIAVLQQWVAAGAQYESHWSLIPPTQPVVPNGSAPQQSPWSRSPIDRFVLARLQKAGLQPSAEATRETLIRRVSFDLTGLPPTLQDIDAFLADTSPNAWETVVDRLLASQRYGERMTSDWLDVARYSDTYGYQVDRDRFVWPWRDWVIRAFNANMPYDEFLTRQLAGDLIEDASRDDILATTFNRLHPQKVEGGSVPEEFRIEYVADRTQTFATAFLGLTMECCRCHDHKYDPLSQREYFQLSAFFDNIDEAGLYSYFTQSIPTPTLLLPTPDEEKRIARLQDQVRERSAKWTDTRALCRGEIESDQPILEIGRVAHLDFESGIAEPNQQVDGKIGQAVRLTGDDPVSTEVGNFPRWQPFSIAFWLQTPDVKERAVIFHRSRAWTDAGSRGYQLLFEEGKLSWSLIHFWPGNAIRIRTMDRPLPTQRWLHVAVTYNGSSDADGMAIYVDGQRQKVEIVRNNLTKQITGGGNDHITIGERFRDRGFTNGLVDEFSIYDRELSPLEIAQLCDGRSLTDALATTPESRTPEQSIALHTVYANLFEPEVAERRAELQAAQKELATTIDNLAEIMVMRELKFPRATYLLTRGAYDQPGDAVQPATPAVLSVFPDELPRNRLGLARWLTSPGHPLTARVAVNRLWQICFGKGLVTTPEDFGSQGKLPTHPQLLDWLAVDFVEHEWDVKRLLKQIVMSATYRQSSQISSKADPENRLLGHGPSYRLPAEMLRDNALAVSGLLVEKIGGPPVKPYEIEESFKPANRDEGDGLYRRSLYTYWKRTGPAPAMMTLDAAKRDVCRVTRERTASPLQSLILLNGPQYVEASRVLAEQVLRRHGEDTREMLVDLFRHLTSRRPTADELQVLQSLHEQQRLVFEASPATVGRYLSVGDLARDESLNPSQVAAISAVAGTLMNYDVCVTKR